MDSLKKIILLVWSGKRLKDKIYILKWILLKKRNKNKKIIVKNKDGEFVCRANNDDLWMTSPYGEKELRKNFLKFKGNCFLDVGANIGKYSILLGNLHKKKIKIISLEPENENFNILKENIKRNKLNNVIPLQVGAYYKKGKIKLNLDKKSSGSHSIVRKKDGKKSEIIEVNKVDNIVKEQKLKSVHLIKIDVEGAEEEVLKGAKKTLLKFHPKIIFECQDKDKIKKIKLFLSKFNYYFKKLNEENYYVE